LFRKVAHNYRKLSKEAVFSTLLRSQLEATLATPHTKLLELWRTVRHGHNTAHSVPAVQRLSQSMMLKLDGLTQLLGLTPTPELGQILTQSGGLRINGAVINDPHHLLRLGSMLQVDLSLQSDLKALYTDAVWSALNKSVSSLSFIHST
jgi:hypothetical protein